MSASIPFLEVRELQASFRGLYGDLDALCDVSFTVARGEFVTLIGPSGCGKSTLLRIVAGLLTPSAGEVLLEGQPLTSPTRRVGLVFQQPTLLPWRTVADNIALPLTLDGADADTIRTQVQAMVRLVGLEGFEREYPLHLSGGMAQRAALARALIQNPELLLLDEPFGALDALTRERMGAELLRIWQAYRRTVLMVTHSVEEAILLADRVIVLSPRPGRVIGNIPVALPRPRTADMVSSAELQNTARLLRELLNHGRPMDEQSTSEETQKVRALRAR